MITANPTFGLLVLFNKTRSEMPVAPFGGPVGIQQVTTPPIKGRTMRRLRTLPVTAALLAALLAAPALAPRLLAEETATAVAATPAPVPDDSTPFVSIDGKDFTLGEFKVAVTFRQNNESPVSPDKDLPTLRGEKLEELARAVAAYNAMTKRAVEAGVELSPEDKLEGERFLDRYAGSELYREHVIAKMVPVTDEQIAAEYEKVKAEKYVQDEELRLRQIFLSTYTEYIVKPGDTLESIAKAAYGGEADSIGRILSFETKRPRNEPIPATDGSEPLPPRALVEGEKLMVPMTDEAAAKVLARANEALGKIKAGTGVVAVANEYSENLRPGELWVVRPKKQDRPILAEITETFFKLKDGETSEPIRTKHGYHIIHREAYVPEGFKPLDELKEVIKQDLENRQRAELTNAFFGSVIETSGVVTFNEANVVKSEAEESPDDVILTIGQREFKRVDFNRSSRDLLKKNENRNVAALKSSIVTLGTFQAAMLSAYRLLPVFADRPKTKAMTTSLNEVQLAQAWLDKDTAANVTPATDAQIAEYYEKNKESFKVEEKVDVSFIQIKELDTLEPGELELLKEEIGGRVAKAPSREAFEAIANEVRLNKYGENTPENGKLGERPITYFIGPMRKILKETKFPGVTPTYDDGNGLVTWYWIQTRTEAGYAPLEDMKAQIATELENQARTAHQQKVMDELKAAAQVKVLVP